MEDPETQPMSDVDLHRAVLAGDADVAAQLRVFPCEICGLIYRNHRFSYEIWDFPDFFPQPIN